ncbi:MAG: lamin tail domain-containing protein [Candidatus Altiarchaeota archaeon]
MKQTNKRMMSLVFTLTIVALLYLSGPSTAITAALGVINDLFRGQVATITGTVTLNDYEFIMTSGSVLLTVDTAANGTMNCTLPLTTGTKAVTCSNNQRIIVTASSNNWDNLSYGYGYDYGYEYTPNTYSYQYGYGYSYSYVWENTQIQYTIKWAIPKTYGNGTFTATLKVYADDTLVDSSQTTFRFRRMTELPRGTVGVRISEIMPNPVGSDSASNPNGEWVELQNTGTSSVNVSGWRIVDDAGQNISITVARTRGNSTVIAARGFIAVHMNAAVLNNDYDTVSLYHSNGTLIDVFGYDADDFAGSGLVDIVPGSPLHAGGYTFKEGVSLILSGATNESSCTGIFIDGQCYAVTNQSTPGESNPGMAEYFAQTLASNWNLISMPLTLDNASTQASFSSIDGSYTLVYQYNASASALNRWLVYDPTVPGGLGNTLNDTSVMWGYWIKVNGTTPTLNVSGNAPAAGSTSTALVSSWNLVGYPSTTAANITTALSSINDNYTLVYLYNASDVNDTWKVYDPTVPGGLGNDLHMMVPGYGYWIKVNATTETLVI